MPIYEYECEACGHRFELIQKYSDPPADVCPTCGEHQVRKRMSSPAFQFKGTGWYVTDYARKDAGTNETQDKAAAKDAKDAKETKDTKVTKDTKETKDAKSAASDSGTPASSSGSATTPPPTPSSSKDS